MQALLSKACSLNSLSHLVTEALPVRVRLLVQQLLPNTMVTIHIQP